MLCLLSTLSTILTEKVPRNAMAAVEVLHNLGPPILLDFFFFFCLVDEIAHDSHWAWGVFKLELEKAGVISHSADKAVMFSPSSSSV